MIRRRSFLKGLLAAFPLGAAAAITRKGPQRPDPRTSPEAFRLDLEKLGHVDPALVGYREGVPLAEGLTGGSSMTLAPDGTLYVSVGSRILRLVSGRAENVIKREGKVTAMAVSGDGSVWCASGPVLKNCDASGQFIGEPVHLGERAYITSIALDDKRLFAADAGQRVVWVLTTNGKLLENIDGRQTGQTGAGFVVPGPWFSLAAGSGELWVANPGQQRVERYVAGRGTGNWGFASMDVEGFCGCCNPTHLALLPDGGFVTSEKGIPRVKVYDRDGNFSSVVAGAGIFHEGTSGLAVAAAPDGRILVLDPVRGQVRTFMSKTREGEA